RVHAMRLGAPDASGRRQPEPVPGTSRSLKADLVILALGFDPEDIPAAFGARDLATTRWGTLIVDPRTMMTSIDGVFAAGDIVRGASLVVWAIREAQEAATAIHRYLAQGHGAATDRSAAAEFATAG
ncbi:MAG: NAD(P)-dependent oxidoreductase, partial [Alphaproteobacteria bacterium]